MKVSTRQNNTEVVARMIFDSGSERSFVSNRIAKQLSLKSIGKQQLSISTFGASTDSLEKKNYDVVNLSLTGTTPTKNELVQFNAISVPYICAPLSNHAVNFTKTKYEHLRDLDLAETGEGVGQVDILIGSDVYWKVFSGKVIRGDVGPVALDTKFGWVLNGRDEGGKATGTTNMLNISHSLRVSTEQNLEQSLHKFWDLETIGIKSDEKSICDELFEEIKCNEKGDIDKWHYCPTDENPADLISKQLPHPVNSVSSELWLHGPSFLQNQPETNPTFISNETDFLPELKQPLTNLCVTTAETTVNLSEIFDFDRYSSFKKLVKVYSWVNRFINNLKESKNRCHIDNILTVQELTQAEESLISENQRSFINSKNLDQLKRQFNVQKDESEILRCYGRLQNAPLQFETKFPILLNRDNKICELIVIDIHILNKHCEIKQTLYEIRQKYWISHRRNYVRKILSQCRTCRKYNGKPYNYPDPPPLTRLRLNDVRPFVVVGVDLCGPLFLKNVFDSNSDELYKGWIVLYTCAASRGVILDLVPNPSSIAFRRSLSRFVSRRGCPDDVISDNGSNFAAKGTQLFACDLNVKWNFNIPLAPWYGGFFERLIRTLNHYLKRQLSNARLTYEEVQTVLFEIEAIMNNRPITYLYPNDLDQCLTPNHLIFGRRLERKSEVRNAEITRECDYELYHKKLSTILDHFLNRWRIEYLADLREQQKYRLKIPKEPNVKIGDIVLIHDEKLPRQLWKMGKIETLIYSKDGRVRGADVRTPNYSVLKRPVSRLYPIECPGNELNTNDELYSPLVGVEQEENEGQEVHEGREENEGREETEEREETNERKPVEMEQNARRSRREAAERAELRIKYL